MGGRSRGRGIRAKQILPVEMAREMEAAMREAMEAEAAGDERRAERARATAARLRLQLHRRHRNFSALRPRR